MTGEQQAPERIVPRSLGDYLEVMTKAVFQAGMSWKVVDAKWPGIREAFNGFDPDAMANMTEAELDALTNDPRVIRNRRKLHAIVGNAQKMVELDSEHGGFRNYLRSHGGFYAAAKDLRSQFKFVGEMGAYFFLYLVGEETPPHDEWVKSRGR